MCLCATCMPGGQKRPSDFLEITGAGEPNLRPLQDQETSSTIGTFQTLLKIISIYSFILCMCMHYEHMEFVKLRGQLIGVGSFATMWVLGSRHE